MRGETKRHYENREFYHGISYGTNNINVNQKSSTSFMFHNFPEAWGMGQLWMVVKKYGTVYDMYMVKKRLRNGQRYGFVRFKNNVNMESLVKALSGIRMGIEYIRVYRAYDRRGYENNRGREGQKGKDANKEGRNGWEAGYGSERDDHEGGSV
ncbi:transposon TX1 [Tanacetum coccineum]